MALWIILTVSLTLGQLIKFPQGAQGGLTVLDVTVVLANLLALANLKLKLKKPPLWILAALVFIFFASLSTLFSPLQLTSGQKLTSFAYTLRFANFILFGWVLLSGVFPKILENTNKILLLSGLGLAVLGLLQLVFLPDLRFLASGGWDPHFFRTVSTLLDPNFTGTYLALTLLVFTQSPGKFTPRGIYVLFFALTYIAFVTTFSRSSALALITSFSLVAFLKKSPKIFILGLLLFLGFIFVFSTYQKTVALPRNISREDSAQARLDTWQQGLEIFQKSPILGVGFNSYRYAIEQYNLSPSEFLQSRGSSTNDSSLLYVLATTGITGLTTYLTFLILMAKQALKSKNSWGFVTLAALVGLLPNSFFVNSLFYPWFLFWIVLATANASKNPA